MLHVRTYFVLLLVSCTNIRDYVADEVKYPDCASFQNRCKIKQLNDNCFVRTHPANCFCDKHCTDQQARPSAVLSSGMPSI